MKIGNIQIKKRFIVFAVAVLLALVIIVSVCTNAILKTRIYWGVLDENRFSNGLIIRDETVYSFGEYGRLDYTRQEGNQVAAGDVIAELYSTNYIQSKLDDLNSQRRNIANYQKNIMKTIMDADLTQLELEISSAKEQLKEKALEGDNAGAARINRRLQELYVKQDRLLREKTRTDEHLTTLYAQEEALMSTISQWKTEITAQSEGVLCTSIDGLEQRVNADKITSLSIADIRAAFQAKKEARIGEGCRVVNTEKWYIALICHENPTLEVNKTYRLYQRGNASPITATFLSQIPDGGEYICLFECGGAMGDLINVRSTQFSIGEAVEGLIVPSSAVVTQDQLQGIYIEENGKKVFVYVQVVASFNGKSVVRPLPDGDGPYLGQTVYR